MVGIPEDADMLIDDDDDLLGPDAETEERCEFVDADGNRCRNHARPGSRFCGVHEAEEL